MKHKLSIFILSTIVLCFTATPAFAGATLMSKWQIAISLIAITVGLVAMAIAVATKSAIIRFIAIVSLLATGGIVANISYDTEMPLPVIMMICLSIVIGFIAFLTRKDSGLQVPHSPTRRVSYQ